MKKMSWIVIMMLAIGLLVGCSSENKDTANQEADAVSESEQDAVQAQEKNQDQLRTDFADNALSEEMQLVVGSFLLDETDLLISADQASDLIPYWKLYLNMQESDTTTSEEFAGLIAGIKQMMSSEQISYIASLELTQEDLMVFMQESGIMEDLRPEGAESEDGQSDRPGRPDGMPEGTGPGGGQGGGPGAGMDGVDPELMATMQAEREADGARARGVDRMNTPLIEALIELLESKIN